MSDGLWQPSTEGFTNDVRALLRIGEDLYAGSTYGVSRWNGSRWDILPGIPEGGLIQDWVVGTMTQQDGQLIVGGKFTTAGGRAANSLAELRGVAWGPVGGGAEVTRGSGASAAAEFERGVVVGGNLRLTDAAGVTAAGTARWDGAAWHAMPGLESTGDLFAWVAALAQHEGDLYAVGSFFIGGGATADGLARWDGVSWRGVEPRLVTSDARAVVSYEGALVVGGYLADGSSQVGAMRLVNGAWETMGHPPGLVTALAVIGGELYAGGSALGGSGAVVVHWTGTDWETMGAWPGGAVLAIAGYGGEIVAGGRFDSGTERIGAARWDGAAWRMLVPGGSQSSVASVTGMASDGASLYLASSFAVVGSTTVEILRWDGATATPIGGLATSNVNGWNPGAALLAGNQVWVGGTFETADGRASPAVARFGPGAPACYANCDCSTGAPALSVADVACFVGRFVAGDPYANCDGSGAEPVLNVNDFVCFLNRFAAGCP
jgi:hypothetical protein